MAMPSPASGTISPAESPAISTSLTTARLGPNGTWAMLSQRSSSRRACDSQAPRRGFCFISHSTNAASRSGAPRVARWKTASCTSRHTLAARAPALLSISDMPQ